MTDAAATPADRELPPSPPPGDGADGAAGVTSPLAASLRICTKCNAPKPLDAYDTGPDGQPFRNCRDCKALAKPKHPKPEGWVAPKPGETPMKRCAGPCSEAKVWSAFPDDGRSAICRACTAGEAPAAREAATPGTKRPTVYTPALGAAIAERIAAGETLKAITADPAMPSKDTLARWRLEHEDLAELLAQARGARADARADEIADLVEAVRTGRVDAQAGRVAIDGLRWLASKDDPRRYGDRVELSNPDGSLKAQVNAAVAIEALIAALPSIGGGKEEAPAALTVVPAKPDPEPAAEAA